jgi:KaiC/GvpD/RAD55 family RecA-like ATPase
LVVALIQCKPQKHGEGGATSSSPDRGRAYAREALNGCVSELAAARQDRNNKANAIAYRMGRMVARDWITRADVIAALFDACDSNGLVQDTDVARVHATLHSGLDAGQEDPHEDLPDRDEHRHANDNIRQESARSTSEIHVTWDGETTFKAATWLVRDLIPDQSTGLIVGESQSAKTFIAIRLAIATATGDPFFSKRTKRGGVVYVAAEAPGTIYDRIEAARLGQVLPDVEAQKRDGVDVAFDPYHLPIAVLDTVPDLARDGGVTKLVESLKRIATEMEARHDVPLRLVIIDTMLAAFALENWNDAAQAAKTSSVLAKIKQELSVTALGLHHHGKDPSRGAAGSFALTAGPDFVLSTFRAFEQTLGLASDRWLVLTKSRSGPTGWGCHFDLVAQKIGQDDEGDDVMGAFVKPNENDGATVKPARKRKDSGSILALRTAVDQALAEHGEPVPVNGDGEPPIPAVRTSHVRTAFDRGYEPRNSGLKNPTQARQKAFTRGVDEACRHGWLQQGVWDDAKWLWRLDS